MKLLGLSPGKIFSGFEKSFFDAIRAEKVEIEHLEIEIPWFKLLCTFTSFHPVKKKWGTRRDLHYHTSIAAFNKKSIYAQSQVLKHQDSSDAIYQVGGLWNPVNDKIKIPLILQVDYTSLLSKKRNSEWKRKPGKIEDFWIEQERILYNTAAVVLTTTENARQSIINDYGIASDHVVTVGGGVSPPYDQLNKNRKPDYNSKKILFIGKGFVGKGLDTILEAFPKVREKIPEATLTIVGPTDFSTELKGVNYLGRIADRNKVKDLYYEHTLFVMPSRFEPLGQVFLEAMSCQLPCIGSTLDAMPELIENAKSGYLIEIGDAEKLALYMIDIISNPIKAEQMGSTGFIKLSNNFTWPIVGRKIVENIKNTVI